MKKRAEFRLSDTSISHLNKFADEIRVSRTEALERIISEHRQNSDSSTDIIADKIISKIENNYKNLFTRLRLAGNYTEQNVQIIIEMLNSIIVGLQLTESFTTEIQKTDILQDSETLVKKRIAKYKQKKDNK